MGILDGPSPYQRPARAPNLARRDSGFKRFCPAVGRTAFNAHGDAGVFELYRSPARQRRMTSDRYDEPRLVEAVQRGDEDAFSRLVEHYTDRGYAFALSILGEPADAEDALQDAFIRALERIDQLSAGSPFGPWFYRVLRSTCLNLRRREDLRRGDEIPASASGEADPERDLEDRMSRRRILVALEKLPEMQRAAVTLYHLEGYSHREVAKILNIAPGTSRAHVHHGRNALREILEPDGETREEVAHER